MDRFCEAFRNIKREYDRRDSKVSDLVCKEGFYSGCPVIKLQKAAWTNDSMRSVPNQSGIFFSVWLDEKGLAKNRAHYNVHALKLRQLEGYKLTSIDFAKHFRQAFKRYQKAWPNVRVDYGPLTLMEGWIEIDLNTFEHDVLELMNGFAQLSRIIDELLGPRAIRPTNGQ
jgi:hypothetical protein